MSSQNLAALGAASVLVYLSHQYDIGYFHRSLLSLLRYQWKKLQHSDADPQVMAHRFLQWFSTPDVVTSRDLDLNWHMNNARYSRKGDFARGKLMFATGILEAAEQLGSWFVVSSISQKFRRELHHRKEFEIWVRFVGWDERHFYVEHIFCYPAVTDGGFNASQTSSYDDIMIEDIKMDRSKQTAYRVVQQRTLEFQGKEFEVASILNTRLTTVRTIDGRVVTPGEVLKKMGLDLVLPATTILPDDVKMWNESIELGSDRLTKGTNKIRSRL